MKNRFIAESERRINRAKRQDASGVEFAKERYQFISMNANLWSWYSKIEGVYYSKDGFIAHSECYSTITDVYSYCTSPSNVSTDPSLTKVIMVTPSVFVLNPASQK